MSTKNSSVNIKQYVPVVNYQMTAMKINCCGHVVLAKKIPKMISVSPTGLANQIQVA